MLIDLLRARIEADSPGTKFVLIRFVQLYGMDAPVALSVKGLAKALGVTDRVTSSAIQQLIAQGLLLQKSTGGKLGRPASSYTCLSDALTEKLSFGGEAIQGVLHEQCIAQLLNGAAHQEAERLLVGNRLLLAVLLAHADEFGVVQGLGARDLSNLTGLKKEVLRQRLDSLKSLQFIRAAVSGVTGAKLFKPTPSQYFLNLGHSMLQAQTAPFSMIFRTRLNYDDCSARVILQAVSEAKRNRMEYIQLGAGFYDVVSLFDDRMPGRLEPMLQTRIDGYASFLLSEHFDGLVEDYRIFHGLFERIQQDFAHLGAEVNSPANSPNDHGSIARLLHAQAVLRALGIKAAIKQAANLPMGKLKYCILPLSKEANVYPAYWALLVISTDGLALYGCQVSDALNGLSLSYEQEAEIKVEERYRYGLLTRPRKSVGSDNT